MYAQPKRILTVLAICDIGWIRSKLIKRHIQHVCRQQGIDVVVDSAGIFPNLWSRLPRQVYNQADIIFSAEQRIEDAVTKAYGKNGKQFVNLDTLNVYWPNGNFSNFFLGLALLGKSQQEVERILNREEIRERYPIDVVLGQRNPMQYLLRKD